jgi:hypothetical protein
MFVTTIKNIQVRTWQKFHEAYSSWIAARVLLQYVVCIGITPHDELLFHAMTVVNDVSHFFGWWSFI